MRMYSVPMVVAAVALSAVFIALPRDGAACTRAVYFGEDGQVVTGRSMDWMEDMQSNLYLFPRGMVRKGAAGKNSVEWTSKYGSVVTSIYEGATADGMNEKGLVANMLFLAESQFPAKDDARPGIAISAWAQFLLDNFATVEEAVKAVEGESFRVVLTSAPNGVAGNVHVSLSDRTGDSAVLEYVAGKLVIHHGREFQVMTNSPVYSEQLSIQKYFTETQADDNTLPGSIRSPDRFARAAYYINAARQTSDPREAVATVASVMRNVSVPRGVKKAGKPNLSETIWRTISDQKNLVYYFENTASPTLVWVRLQELDFSEKSGVRVLKLSKSPDMGGNQTKSFEGGSAFRFLGEG